MPSGCFFRMAAFCIAVVVLTAGSTELTASAAELTASSTEFYVNVATGNDANSGTSPNAAFATLTAAQRAVRGALGASPPLAGGDVLTVSIAPGSYALAAPLVFGAADSAPAGASVLWTGDGAGVVSVNGGGLLDPAKQTWKNVSAAAATAAAAAAAAGAGAAPQQQQQQQQACAADYGTSTPCCGQPGKPVAPQYICPAGAPVCSGYVYGQHYGTCGAARTPFTLWATDISATLGAGAGGGAGGFGGRHLWVGGQRAPRTTLDGAGRATLFQGSSGSDAGFQLAAGAASALALAWPAGGAGVEFVYPQQGSPWTEPRCAVANVTAGGQGSGGGGAGNSAGRAAGAFIHMMQPCFTNLRNKPCRQGAKSAPDIVENVGAAAIGAPREWALDSRTGILTLALSDEDAPAGPGAVGAPAVVAPLLETLLEATDVANVAFENLTFEHATWLRPAQGDGYVEQQTGACLLGSDFARNSDCTGAGADARWYKSPGNLRVRNGSAVAFRGCEFRALGGNGLDIGGGSHGCSVAGCLFRDISGAAVQIGAFDTAHEADPALQDTGNSISDTVINRAAAEYRGAAGISVGYTAGTSITHCDVHNLTYGAISVGWGWSRTKETPYVGRTTIAFNAVHDYKQLLNDGGGIYMLGTQNGSKIHGNHVYHQGTSSSGALYPDEGSAYSEWFGNVVEDIPRSNWLHLWNPSIHDIPVHGNWVDTAQFLNHGTNCPMSNNTVFTPGKPPAEAQAIIDAAGPRPGMNRFRG